MTVFITGFTEEEYRACENAFAACVAKNIRHHNEICETYDRDDSVSENFHVEWDDDLSLIVLDYTIKRSGIVHSDTGTFSDYLVDAIIDSFPYHKVKNGTAYDLHFYGDDDRPAT